MKKRAWCYFCDKRVWYNWVKVFKTYYHVCPTVGYPVKIGIGNTRIKEKGAVESENTE